MSRFTPTASPTYFPNNSTALFDFTPDDVKTTYLKEIYVDQAEGFEVPCSRYTSSVHSLNQSCLGLKQSG